MLLKKRGGPKSELLGSCLLWARLHLGCNEVDSSNFGMIWYSDIWSQVDFNKYRWISLEIVQHPLLVVCIIPVWWICLAWYDLLKWLALRQKFQEDMPQSQLSSGCLFKHLALRLYLNLDCPGGTWGSFQHAKSSGYSTTVLGMLIVWIRGARLSAFSECTLSH